MSLQSVAATADRYWSNVTVTGAISAAKTQGDQVLPANQQRANVRQAEKALIADAKATALQVSGSFAQAYSKAKNLDRAIENLRIRKQAEAACKPGERFVLVVPVEQITALQVTRASERRDRKSAEVNSNRAPTVLWDAISLLERRYRDKNGNNWKTRCAARDPEEAG